MRVVPNKEASFSGDFISCGPGNGACDDLDVRLSRGWLRVGIAAVFAGQGMALSLALSMTPPELGTWAYWLLHGGLAFSSLIVMIFLGGPLFAATLAMIRERRLSIEGLFCLSLLGAFFGSLAGSITGSGSVYYEVVAIVVAIYTIGRMLGERSQARALTERDRVRERFDQAEVWREDQWIEVSLLEVSPKDRVRTGPGGAFTVDGIILSGDGYVQETAMTGEPLPVVRHPGESIKAGTWSIDGDFEVLVTASVGSRELDTILETVDSLGGRPSAMQHLANRLIGWFLPVVAGTSALTAFYWWFAASWVESVLNSMAVLLVACPCALGLATPVAVWQGLFRLAKMGMVSRDGALVDALAETKHIFFDKTGTLSEGVFRVTEFALVPAWQGRRVALCEAIYGVESRLDHPVARSLVAYLRDDYANGVSVCEKLSILPGRGVEASTAIGAMRIGEADLCPQVNHESILGVLRESGGKRVFVFVEGDLAAVLVLREGLRAGLSCLFNDLNDLNVETTVLTGDPNPQIRLPEGVCLQSGCRAEEKESIVRSSMKSGAYPVVVGDGINDVSAMSAAAASLSMGSGTPLTRSTASAQLMGDQINNIPRAIRLAREIRSRLRGNLYYATVYNLLGMGFAATGYLHPVVAALIMLISSFWVTARVLALKTGYNDD
ncbi:MAG: heavy metal translocating P-type ATPase [Coraliomargaritaceae bacterium]